jgi:hypothetical protein
MYIVLAGDSIQTETELTQDGLVKIKCVNPKGDIVEVYLSPDQVTDAYQKIISKLFAQ